MASLASGGFVGTVGAVERAGDAAVAGVSGQEALLARLDAHLGGHPLVHELCAVPAGPGTRPLRYWAAIRPRAAELSRRQVIQLVTRFREDLAKLACTFPSPLALEDVVCLDEPLPRGRGGAVDRAAVAARLRAWREERRASLEGEQPDEMWALARRPGVARFLARLATVLGTRAPLRAALHLERDLGVDSLAQVQLRALLEQEFGVVVPDTELWTLATVGDAMRRVAAANHPRLPTGTYDWRARLAEPAAEPFEERFPEPRGLAMRLRVAAMRALWRALAPLVHGGCEVRGLERLPSSGPFLLAPTHQSLIDAAFVFGALPSSLVRRMAFVGYGEHFHEGFMSTWVRPARIIRTGEADSVADSLRVAHQALGRGMAVTIFPEGERSWLGRIQAPKLGTAILACHAQVPIVPAIFQGSRCTLSHERPGWRPGRIRLVIGEPIAPPAPRDFGRADHEALMGRWLEAVTRLEAEHGGRDA